VATCSSGRSGSPTARAERAVPRRAAERAWLAVYVAVLIAACTVAPPAAPTAPGPASDAAMTAALIKRGYRAVNASGRTLFCRDEEVTGSQFRHTVCLTEEQVRIETQNADDMADFLSRTHGIDCSGRQGNCQK
jgi:hypothetical protein